jgi:7-cyano-7-deazaguanine synthase in queuosine biosynthesis
MDVNLKAENEAIKFLYACLEDIELERVTSMAQRYEYKQNVIVYSLISFQSYDD